MKSSFLILALLLAACTPFKDAYENYIHDTLEQSAKTLDPIHSNDAYSSLPQGQIFEGLLQYAHLERPLKLEPLLAAAMPQISSDKKQYTFKIKQGVYFHDDPCFKATNGKGRELVSEDFIFSWKRLADPKNSSDGFWIFDSKIKGINKWREQATKKGVTDYTLPIEGLKAPDRTTLVITLEKPFPQFLFMLANSHAVAVPSEAVAHYGPEILNHPVGTGPYVLKSWIRGSKIVVTKNPNYRKEFYPSSGETVDQENGLLKDAGASLPLNEGVVFHEATEDKPRYYNFRKGNFDFAKLSKNSIENALDKNGELLPELQKLGIRLSRWSDLDFSYEYFNMKDPLIGSNKYLRQAISLTIDPDDFVAKFFKFRGEVAHGPIPPGVLGYNEKIKNPYNHLDLDRAKALLAKAGYPGGKGLPPITYDINNNANDLLIAQLVQNSVAKIGITMKIVVNSWPEYITKIKSKRVQMFSMAYTADYPDGENFLQLFYGPNETPGPNDSNYNNPTFNRLFEQASGLSDSPARSELFTRMVDLILEDVPLIPHVHRRALILTHAWLHNYKRNKMSHNYPKYLRLDLTEKSKLKKNL